MITCPNCGAEIKEDLTKCPYCGYINAEGAVKKHLQNIEKIKENIEDAKKEPRRALVKGLSKGAKIVLWTVGTLAVLVALYAIIIAIGLRHSPKMFLSADEKAYASAYKAVAEEQLAAAYEDNDIAQMAQIYDKAYSEDRVSLWGDPHYETGYAASCYMKLMQCLPNLDKNKIKKREAEEITYYCFYFYYEGYGEDGAVIFDSIREEEILPIIRDRLGFTIEEMESFRDKITDPPHVIRTEVHRVAKSHYKNYH